MMMREEQSSDEAGQKWWAAPRQRGQSTGKSDPARERSSGVVVRNLSLYKLALTLILRYPFTLFPTSPPSSFLSHTPHSPAFVHWISFRAQQMEEVTQSFCLAGETDIIDILCDNMDGQNIIHWAAIEEIFPGVKYVKRGNIAINSMMGPNQTR